MANRLAQMKRILVVSDNTANLHEEYDVDIPLWMEPFKEYVLDKRFQYLQIKMTDLDIMVEVKQ